MKMDKFYKGTRKKKTVGKSHKPENKMVTDLKTVFE